jgi:hypothetical protein
MKRTEGNTFRFTSKVDIYFRIITEMVSRYEANQNRKWNERARKREVHRNGRHVKEYKHFKEGTDDRVKSLTSYVKQQMTV